MKLDWLWYIKKKSKSFFDSLPISENKKNSHHRDYISVYVTKYMNNGVEKEREKENLKKKKKKL